MPDADHASPVLSSDDIATFIRDGCVAVRGAFAAEQALRMQDMLWRHLAAFGIDRADRTTWDRRYADLRRAGQHPVFDVLSGERLRHACDALI